MRERTLKVLFLIVGLAIGFIAGSLSQTPQATTSLTISKTILEKTTKIATHTTITTAMSVWTTTSVKILTRTRTIELGEEILTLQTLTKPHLRKMGDRWIWFNITVSIISEEDRPIKGVRVIVDDVKEAVTNDQGAAELGGIKAGVHHLKIEWKEHSLEKDLELAFPDIDPDLTYVDLISKDRRSKVTFVAAYYGWYGIEDLNWVHWGDPEDPATKYLPLLGQISGTSTSQSYSLYGFSLDEEKNLRLVKRQMALAKMAGISAFAVSWWGPNSFEDKFMPTIMKAAEEVGFKVTVIFEPFYKNFPNKWNVVEKSIDYLKERYMESEVWLRDSEGKPVVFTFDIGSHEEWNNWKRILSGRNMAWVAHTTDRSVLEYGFKYFYEYSPVGIVAAGGDIMSVYMGVSDIPPYDRLFIPTISPRYDDTKVRSPGYSIGDELWESSVEATKAVLAHRKPEFVFMTSWNEWHESTSIEPDTGEGFRFLMEFGKEFYGMELSEEDFLKALGVLDCLELCGIYLR